MQEILWDVLRADVLSQQIITGDSSKSLTDENSKLTKKVFTIHDITEEQFQKSYSYYTQHPDKFKNILDSLNVRQIRKSSVEIPVNRKQLIKDSDKIYNGIR